jgi:hypothetical protein
MALDCQEIRQSLDGLEKDVIPVNPSIVYQTDDRLVNFMPNAIGKDHYSEFAVEEIKDALKTNEPFYNKNKSMAASVIGGLSQFD